MYKSFYHLKENPFSLNPDPHFLFPSDQHKEAFKLILYALENREGLVELVGEVGCGKTLLCRVLLSSLGETVRTALILNPPSTRTEFLETLMEDLGLPYKNKSYKDLLQDLANFLTSEYAKGHNVVVFIDEAQDLNLDVLEGIRFLTNIETNKKKLIQIVLVGQPELEINLRTPQLRHVDQRIGLRCHLKPLTKKEMVSYVYHRLKVAGTDEIKFSKQALSKIYRFSKGIPRLINQVCDKTLITAYFYKQSEIDAKVVTKALKATQKRWFRYHIPELVYPLHAAFAFAMVCILILFGINWYMHERIISWTNQMNPTLGVVRGSVMNRMNIAPEVAEAKTKPTSSLPSSGQTEKVNSVTPPLPENKGVKQNPGTNNSNGQSTDKDKVFSQQADMEKKISQQLAELTAKLSEEKDNKQKLEDKEKNINQRLTKLNDQLEELKKLLSNKESKTSQEIGRLNEQLQKTQQELNKEKEAKQNISSMEKGVNQKLTKLNEQLEEFKKQSADKESKAGQQINKLSEQLQKTQAELNKATENKQQKTGKEQELNLKLSKLNDQLEEFKKQLAAKDSKSGQEISKLGEQLQKTQAQLNQERDAKQQKSGKEQELNLKLSKLNDQLEEFKKQLAAKDSKSGQEISKLGEQLQKTQAQLNQERDAKQQKAGKEQELNLRLTKLNEQLEEFKKQALTKEQKTAQDLAKMSENLAQTQQKLLAGKESSQQVAFKEKDFNQKLAGVTTQLERLQKDLTTERDKNQQINSKTGKVDQEIARLNEELGKTRQELSKAKITQVAAVETPKRANTPVPQVVPVVVAKNQIQPRVVAIETGSNKTEKSQAEAAALISLFKLWGKEVNSTQAATWPINSGRLDFKAVAGRYGLEASILDTNINEIINLNLPCIILPAGNITSPVLLSRMTEHEIYSQDTVHSPEEFAAWSGKAVILWENVDKLRDGDIPLEEGSAELSRVAIRLQQLGYLTQPKPDIKQISYALLNFQRDHAITGKALIGVQTKLVLYRIINQPITPTLTREFI